MNNESEEISNISSKTTEGLEDYIKRIEDAYRRLGFAKKAIDSNIPSEMESKTINRLIKNFAYEYFEIENGNPDSFDSCWEIACNNTKFILTEKLPSKPPNKDQKSAIIFIARETFVRGPFYRMKDYKGVSNPQNLISASIFGESSPAFIPNVYVSEGSGKKQVAGRACDYIKSYFTDGKAKPIINVGLSCGSTIFMLNALLMIAIEDDIVFRNVISGHFYNIYSLSRYISANVKDEASTGNVKDEVSTGNASKENKSDHEQKGYLAANENSQLLLSALRSAGLKDTSTYHGFQEDMRKNKTDLTLYCGIGSPVTSSDLGNHLMPILGENNWHFEINEIPYFLDDGGFASIKNEEHLDSHIPINEINAENKIILASGAAKARCVVSMIMGNNLEFKAGRNLFCTHLFLDRELYNSILSTKWDDLRAEIWAKYS